MILSHDVSGMLVTIGAGGPGEVRFPQTESEDAVSTVSDRQVDERHPGGLGPHPMEVVQ